MPSSRPKRQRKAKKIHDNSPLDPVDSQPAQGDPNGRPPASGGEDSERRRSGILRRDLTNEDDEVCVGETPEKPPKTVSVTSNARRILTTDDAAESTNPASDHLVNSANAVVPVTLRIPANWRRDGAESIPAVPAAVPEAEKKKTKTKKSDTAMMPPPDLPNPAPSGAAAATSATTTSKTAKKATTKSKKKSKTKASSGILEVRRATGPVKTVDPFPLLQKARWPLPESASIPNENGVFGGGAGTVPLAFPRYRIRSEDKTGMLFRPGVFASGDEGGLGNSTEIDAGAPATKQTSKKRGRGGSTSKTAAGKRSRRKSDSATASAAVGGGGNDDSDKAKPLASSSSSVGNPELSALGDDYDTDVEYDSDTPVEPDQVVQPSLTKKAEKGGTAAAKAKASAAMPKEKPRNIHLVEHHSLYRFARTRRAVTWRFSWLQVQRDYLKRELEKHEAKLREYNVTENEVSLPRELSTKNYATNSNGTRKSMLTKEMRARKALKVVDVDALLGKSNKVKKEKKEGEEDEEGEEAPPVGRLKYINESTKAENEDEGEDAGDEDDDGDEEDDDEEDEASITESRRRKKKARPTFALFDHDHPLCTLKMENTTSIKYTVYRDVNETLVKQPRLWAAAVPDSTPQSMENAAKQENLLVDSFGPYAAPEASLRDDVVVGAERSTVHVDPKVEWTAPQANRRRPGPKKGAVHATLPRHRGINSQFAVAVRSEKSRFGESTAQNENRKSGRGRKRGASVFQNAHSDSDSGDVGDFYSIGETNRPLPKDVPLPFRPYESHAPHDIREQIRALYDRSLQFKQRKGVLRGGIDTNPYNVRKMPGKTLNLRASTHFVIENLVLPTDLATSAVTHIPQGIEYSNIHTPTWRASTEITREQMNSSGSVGQLLNLSMGSVGSSGSASSLTSSAFATPMARPQSVRSAMRSVTPCLPPMNMAASGPGFSLVASQSNMGPVLSEIRASFGAEPDSNSEKTEASVMEEHPKEKKGVNDDEESEEDDSDLKYAKLHYSRELDEQRLYLAPIRDAEGNLKLRYKGRETLSERTVETLACINRVEKYMREKGLKKPPIPEEAELKRRGYMHPLPMVNLYARQPRTDLGGYLDREVPFAPNDQNPPLRILYDEDDMNRCCGGNLEMHEMIHKVHCLGLPFDPTKLTLALLQGVMKIDSIMSLLQNFDWSIPLIVPITTPREAPLPPPMSSTDLPANPSLMNLPPAQSPALEPPPPPQPPSSIDPHSASMGLPTQSHPLEFEAGKSSLPDDTPALFGADFADAAIIDGNATAPHAHSQSHSHADDTLLATALVSPNSKSMNLMDASSPFSFPHHPHTQPETAQWSMQSPQKAQGDSLTHAEDASFMKIRLKNPNQTGK